MEPSIGKENLGAVIGAVLGAAGGLFAVAIPLAIMTKDLLALSLARKFGLISFAVCVPVGWFAGGYASYLLEKKLPTRISGILGGIIGGLLPVGGFALWGWYLVSR